MKYPPSGNNLQQVYWNGVGRMYPLFPIRNFHGEFRRFSTEVYQLALVLNFPMGEREAPLGQGAPEAKPDHIISQSEGEERSQTAEEIQWIKDSVLEQWRSLPPEGQAAVLLEQLHDVLADDQGEPTRRQLELQAGDTLGEVRNAMLRVKDVAVITGYSRVRLLALLKEGCVVGEKRPGRTCPEWYTTIAEVERYRASRPNPREHGLRGALKRWRQQG